MRSPELHYIDLHHAPGVWQTAAPGSLEWARLAAQINPRWHGEQTIVTEEWIVRWVGPTADAVIMDVN